MAKKKPTVFDSFDDNSADPLDVKAVAVKTPYTPPVSVHVPNVFPTLGGQSYRIAIIGDYPHRADAYHKRPFCPQGTPDHPYSGATGSALNIRLSQSGILRDACYVGNLCQHTGHEKQIDKYDFSDPVVQMDIAQLMTDLDKFKPNLIILLGRAPLFLANGNKNLDGWRGSVFISEVFSNRKCLATYHPIAGNAEFHKYALLYFDLQRAAREGKTPNHTPPVRDLRINLTLEQTIAELNRIKQTKPTIALDIEGYVDAMSCLSIADAPNSAFIVVLGTKSNNNVYESTECEASLWRALADVLEDVAIPKVLQNSLYDRFVLQYSYGLVVRGIVDDTMLKHWELYCEFEKSLGFQASIYTDEPYYKQQRKDPDLETFHRYCCRDSAVTLEISNKLTPRLAGGQLNHYKFNLSLLNPLLYMENRGIQYDSSAAREALTLVESHMAVLQAELDTLSGKGLPAFDSFPDLLKRIQSVMCYKRDPEQPKKDYVEIYHRIRQLLIDASAANRTLTIPEQYLISTECEYSMNIKSPMFKDYLYSTLKLPVQYKKNKETGELAPTTDYEALLKLQKISPCRSVDLAIQLGLLRTRSQMLHISADQDGRVRCGYNIVGTETGRLTCYTSPTGSGYNLQTIPSGDATKPPTHPLHAGMRHLFQADEGYYMFQCDLSGADGWTVAAHCAALGDRTLLDDYLSGIKPAKVLCYLLRHGANSLAGKTREEIKYLTKEVNKEDWDYFACKCGQHGSCYLMGPQKLADLIFVQSEGQLSLSVKEVKDLQNLFFLRYRVKLWHDWMGRQLRTNPVIVTSSGYRRRFYGRPTEILGQALAHEPQAVTTYATNLAMYKLWTDPENRQLTDNRCQLKIEPLHQVHDALVGQFKIESAAWAINKIKSYFANPIVVAGITLTIPFEGNYGTSWGTLDEGTI